MTRLQTTRSPLAKLLPAAALMLGAMLLAGCETTGPGAGPAASAQVADKPAEPPMTHARAAELCWMSTEKGAASQNLDKRADLVNKCIDEKMKSAGGPKS